METVPGWLDFAKIRYGGSHSDEAVDEAKKMGPVFLLLVLMVPFWLIFLQSNTGFQAQAVHLKVDLGNFMVLKSNNFNATGIIKNQFFSVPHCLVGCGRSDFCFGPDPSRQWGFVSAA